jgi:eukaryotic-like serine/threonine-protein kinase
MSPEQARGGEANARSDIYSTGCLLYELLTGSPPFGRGDPIAIAWRHVNELPVPPSGNPVTGKRILPAVDAIVMKALAKPPGERYRTAAEMRADVQRALSEQPVTALTEFQQLVLPAGEVEAGADDAVGVDPVVAVDVLDGA